MPHVYLYTGTAYTIGVVGQAPHASTVASIATWYLWAPVYPSQIIEEVRMVEEVQVRAPPLGAGESAAAVIYLLTSPLKHVIN